jgi:hypothetical protein
MTMKSFSGPWQTLGTVPVDHLVEAKVQLHWAAQIVAAFGNTLLDPQPDDSQSNLGWVDRFHALCSHSSLKGLSVGLRPEDLTLLFLTSPNAIHSELGLSGQTLRQAFEWLTATYSKASGSMPPKPFALRDYVMPSHPVAKNEAFQGGHTTAFQELQNWYANTHHVIHSVSGQWEAASPIRCWPHYFDIATLVSLPLLQNCTSTGTVGCGMSPGDASYAEPYFYVTVWPYPEKSTLPDLTIGKWHTEGFVAAVLTASDLLSSEPKETQAQRVHQFFQKSSELAFDALGASPS